MACLISYKLVTPGMAPNQQGTSQFMGFSNSSAIANANFSPSSVGSGVHVAVLIDSKVNVDTNGVDSRVIDGVTLETEPDVLLIFMVDAISAMGEGVGTNGDGDTPALVINSVGGGAPVDSVSDLHETGNVAFKLKPSRRKYCIFIVCSASPD